MLGDECVDSPCPVGAYCMADFMSSNKTCVCPFVGRCDGVVSEVRLVGGNSTVEGRVEVLLNGMWGTVCDNFWDLGDASVVCRQLGYRFATAAWSLAFYGAGGLSIVMDNVTCIGNESRLQDCQFDANTDGCSHSEDAGVVCGTVNVCFSRNCFGLLLLY